MARRIRLIDGRPDGYWRCGAQHTRTGAIFGEEAFSDAEWARLMADPALSVEGVSEADAAAPDPVVALQGRVRDAITAFTAAEFGKLDRRPKLGALRDALPEDKDAITAELRDLVWDALLEGGFKAPSAPEE